MRKIKSMILGSLAAVMLCTGIMAAGSSTCLAAGENITSGEVYDTATEAVYG